RHRPIAAHAALRILVRLAPGEQEVRQSVESLFGPGSRLPSCARRFYELRRRPQNLPPERNQIWNSALAQPATESPRLGAVATAFEQVVGQAPDDRTAWYNLLVVRAWLGENRKALDALDRYLELENDEAQATAAAALGEVLRCGQGLEDLAD